MTDNNSQKGLGKPLTISIIALVLVIAGFAYFAIQRQSKEAAQLQERERALTEREAMEKKENATTTKQEAEATTTQ